jgi:hypothetical protein
VRNFPPEIRRVLLVRQGPLSPEEQAVLSAVERRLSAQGRAFATVFLGTSSYDAESPEAGIHESGEQWLLEEDARGRGLRSPPGRPRRTLTPDELVAEIMTAEKVVQFP